MAIRLLRLFVPLAAALIWASCSRNESGTNPSSGRLIEIDTDDTMLYSVVEISASPGEVLSIRLTNTGRMPKSSMAHNWVLVLPMDSDALNDFGMRASKLPPDYIPKYASEVIAYTQMIGRGESDTIVFSAPEVPGRYPYLCTFPGHFAIMRGVLVVEMNPSPVLD